MDTSIHDWFEGRGETAVLITMIDDATNHVFQRFFASDTTVANMAIIGDYIASHGRPIALYTDWASHFKHTSHRKERRMMREKQTQIERALGELGIELIAARSPQAKGRVERRFGVEQDRLVKAPRLNNFSHVDAAKRLPGARLLPTLDPLIPPPPPAAPTSHRRAPRAHSRQRQHPRKHHGGWASAQRRARPRRRRLPGASGG